jgi:hypothetical protein
MSSGKPVAASQPPPRAGDAGRHNQQSRASQDTRRQYDALLHAM